MDFNTIMMFVGVAVFILPVTYMLGYARREKQHGDTIKKCEENVSFQRHTLMQMHQTEIAQERNVVRELEISLLKAGESIEVLDREVDKYRNQWKYADSYRKALVESLVVNHLWDFRLHNADPMEMLAVLINAERAEALDPAVSKQAKNLHTRGVRKGAKAGREQMRKLMQKSIDNQAMTIEMLQSDLKMAQDDFDDVLLRKNIMFQAYNNILNDKIALPSVRKAFKVAVLNERGRLTQVSKKNVS